MCELLRMTFNLNPNKRRSIWNSRAAFRHRDDFNGMHWFRLHPLHTPSAEMNRSFHAGAITNGAICAMITNVRRPTTCIPVQKETRPTVVMHRFCHARKRHGDFEHAHKFIFENNFVAVRRGLYGVVAVGETRLVLPINIQMPR